MYVVPSLFVRIIVAGPGLRFGIVSVSVFWSVTLTVAAGPPTVAEVEELNPLPRTVICAPGDTVPELNHPIDSGA